VDLYTSPDERPDCLFQLSAGLEVGLTSSRYYLEVEKEFFIDNLLVRIHRIVVKIRWAGLAPYKFETPFPGSLIDLHS